MLHLVLIAILLVAAIGVRLYFVETLLKRTERISKGEFLLALSGLLAKTASADGTVSSDEAETVGKMFADMGLSRAERAMCVGNFILAQREDGDARALARELAAALDPLARRFLYGLVLRVALADWRIANEEESLLKDIGVGLALGDDERDELRKGNAPAFDVRALEDAGVPSAVARLGLLAGGLRDAGLGIWDR